MADPLLEKTDPLDDFEHRRITLQDRTKLVFVAGSGPAVIVMTEMPGISPHVARFARWIRDAGFTVWMPSLFGTTWRGCLVFIPLLSAGPLAAILVALRRGAPTRPALAGAVAGLLAGGIGSFVYAAHCPGDSPLFLGAWYTITILEMAALGALAGSRLLRW